MNSIEEKVAKVAYELSKTSYDDIRSAKLLYSNKLYPQAFYFLQQSVEKSAKACGLLIGSVKIKELKSEVGHISALSVIPHFSEAWNDIKQEFNSLVEEPEKVRKGKSLLRRILPDLMPKLKEMNKAVSLIKIEKIDIKLEKSKLTNLEYQKTMWQDTLNMNMENSEVKDALSKLEREAWEPKQIKPVFFLIPLLEKSRSEDSIKMAFYLHIYRGSWRLGSLVYLTMWHESTTRYPKMNDEDYGEPNDYNSKSPIVKKFNFLTKHASLSAREILAAASLALK